MTVFDWLEGIPLPDGSSPYDVVELRFKNNRKQYVRRPNAITVHVGDVVVVFAPVSKHKRAHQPRRDRRGKQDSICRPGIFAPKIFGDSRGVQGKVAAETEVSQAHPRTERVFAQ